MARPWTAGALALIALCTTSCTNRVDADEIAPFGRVRSAVWFEMTVDSQQDDSYDHTSHVFMASNQPGLCEALQRAAVVLQEYSDQWYGGIDDLEWEEQCEWYPGYLAAMDEAFGPHMQADAHLIGMAYYDAICIHPRWPPEGTWGPACSGEGEGGLWTFLLYLQGDYYPDAADNLRGIFPLSSGASCTTPDTDELASVEHHFWSDADAEWEVEKVDAATIRLTFEMEAMNAIDQDEFSHLSGAVSAERCSITVTPQRRLVGHFEPFEFL